jgi:hypothetical protein
MKSDHVALTREFIELSKHRDRWHQALEGLDVKKSAFLEEIRKESRQEGHLEEKASMIVQLLRTRFPNQVSADLSAAIETSRERARLEHWFNIAATESSLEGFRKACGL